ncbi:MAG: hypothetical protein IJP28_01810, partial [Erysipelotrichales bacterium]|nr:hypothetical protein [Erysipelotrichales bacterium]
CEFTYLLPYGWEESIAESGATFQGYRDHKQLSEQIKNAYAKSESIIEDYDLVIYEQFFFLGKHLAKRYHKPVVRIFTAPVANQTLMEEYIQRGPLSIFQYKWIARAFTKDIAKNIPLQTDHWLDEILYNTPDLNLVYTLPQYQPYIEEYPKDQYIFLGPSIYPRKEERFTFTKTRPLLYIALGTIVKGSAKFYQTCIQAFKKQDIDVILSVGNYPIHKLHNIPTNIHIYDHVPQLQVLQQADVFITHGGMNSISEALVASTPMVVIPFHSDQPVNARCVEKLGVGKRLNYTGLQANVLRDTVYSVMEDIAIKENMERVQEMIKVAPGNRGGAECIIQYYEAKR